MRYFARPLLCLFFVLARGNVELFDEIHDPGETKNLASNPANGDVIRQLAQKLHDHMREVGDQGLAKLDARFAQLGAKP